MVNGDVLLLDHRQRVTVQGSAHVLTGASDEDEVLGDARAEVEAASELQGGINVARATS